MSELATYTLAPIFRTARQAIEGFRDVVLAKGAAILKTEEQASIRRLWYDTGATLQSLWEEVITEGNRKVYRLFPTTFYAIFGEYGTGRAGAGSGRPAPRGYTYGRKAGMTARRYSRTAVLTAKPKIDRMASEQARRFAANMTS